MVKVIGGGSFFGGFRESGVGSEKTQSVGTPPAAEVPLSTPGGRHWPGAGHAVRQFAHQGGSAAADLNQYKQVVVGLVHGHAFNRAMRWP
jgi:enoyl-CoA hydratase/carnithine racemase